MKRIYRPAGGEHRPHIQTDALTRLLAFTADAMTLYRIERHTFHLAARAGQRRK